MRWRPIESEIATFNLTNFSDQYPGSPPDWANNAGADRINGGDGQDVIDAGDGADFIVAGDGNDTIWGDAGNDEIIGGSFTLEVMGASAAQLQAQRMFF